MNPIVLVGLRHDCPIYGIGIVETGSADYTFNRKTVARVGDRISCGALLTT